MKKFISLFLVFPLVLVALMLTACGTVTVNFNTNGGSTVNSIQVGPNDGQKIQDIIDDIIKSNYDIEGVYYDSIFSDDKKWSINDKINSNVDLYIKWIGKQYNVIFNANEGTGIMANQIIRYNETDNLTANTFTREGYTFVGWNTKVDGDGISIDNNSSYKMETAGITLYAQWDATSFNVTFNSNGGTGNMVALPIKFSESKLLSENKFTRTGYTFAGWATSANGIKVYNDKASYTMTTHGQELFAVWTPNTSSVIFNANTGTGEMANQTFTYDLAQNLTANTFAKTGYTFAGWATSADGNVVYTNQQLVSNLITTNNGEVNLYAKWTANNFAVIFNPNSGTGTMANQTFTYNVAKTLTQNAYAKTGYTFAGWATSIDGDVVYADKASVSNLTSTNGGEVNLYAKWTANNFNVVFNSNGGTGNMANQAFTYDVAQKLTENTFAQIGYSFAGWAKTADGNVEYTDEQSVSNLTATNNGSVNLYAKWTAEEQTLTFNANFEGYTAEVNGTMAEQTIAYDASANLTANSFTRTGYTFAGWATSANGDKIYDNSANYTMTTLGATLYAKWTANNFAVIFNANTGTGEMANQAFTYDVAKSLTQNEFTKTGYTFAGWATSANGEVVYTNEQSVSNLTSTNGGEFNLYAKWTADNQTLTFNANGGTGTMADQTIAYDASANLTANTFTRTGYTFAGWATSAEGDKVYNDNANCTMTTLGATLYAKWTANNFAVIFNANTGTGTMANQAFTYDVAKELTANTFAKTGYSFAGWAITAEGNVKYTNEQSVSNLTTVNGGEFNLYAKWTANNFSVIFNANTGTGTMANQAFTYDVAQELTANTFAKTGYTFAGWATSANGEVVYTNEQSVSNLTTVNGGEFNLYAKWTANNQTLTFNANGGTGTMADQTIAYDASANLTANTFTKTGYTFAGWATSAEGDKVYNDNANYTMSTLGAILYAKWTADNQTLTFNANGGTGTMADQTIAYDASANLTANTFTRTGYTFAGWATSAEGSKEYNDNANYTMTTLGATLYAKWTANNQTLTFDANGGTGTMADQTIAFDASANLTANTFTRTGHIFAGWATTAGGDKVFNDNASYTMTTLGATLYAKWTVETYNITFKYLENDLITIISEYGKLFNEAQDFNTTEYDNISVPTGKEKGGFYLDLENKTTKYEFNSTTPDFGENNANITLHLFMATQTGILSLDYNEATGGNEVSTINVIYNDEVGTLPTPTKTGYTFVGWYSSNTVWSEDNLITATTIWNDNFNTIYAKWVETDATYAISYTLNGGEATTTSYNYETKTDIINPTKTHYTVKKLTLTENAYLNKDLVLAGTELPKDESGYYIPANSYGNISITVEWQAVNYNIAFNANFEGYNAEANGTMADQTIAYDSSANLTANTFTRTGYTFAGWATTTVGDKEYNDNATYTMATAGATLYAKWIADNQTLIFNANGGTGTMADQTIAYDASANLTANTFTRTGYTFAGWATSVDGDKVYDNSANYTMTTLGATLYAKWTAEEQTLKFNANFEGYTAEVNGTMAEQTIAYDASANLTANSFTRTGYTFAGWATSANGDKVYDNSANYTMTTLGATLYAKWTANSYNVKFNANSGTGTMENQAFTYDVEQRLTQNTFTKTGYFFAGWSTTIGGSLAYTNQSLVNNLISTNNGEVNLYAIWLANAYFVIFNANTGTGTMTSQFFDYDSAKLLKANEFTKTGYSFAGWATSANSEVVYTNEQSVSNLSTVNGGEFNLYAKWTADNQTLTFNANGGTGIMADQTIAYDASANLTANEFTKTGYIFAGWATSAEGSKEYNDNANYTMTTLGATLYAKWTADNQTLTFNANGGTGIMAEQTIAYDASANLTANLFTRTGYTFAGWATSANGDKVYDNSASYTMTTLGATLYAKWTANTASVIFKANGGTGTMANQVFTYDVTQTLSKNTFTQTGYTFAGWATNPNNEVSYTDEQSITNLSTSNNAVINLYAKWTISSFELIFDANGGTGTMPTQTITFNDSEEINANVFTKTGYTFSGWAITAEGNVVYNNNASYTMSTEGATLYAVWAVETYSVNLYKDAENFNVITVEFNKTIANSVESLEAIMAYINANAPTGKEFGYWSVEGIETYFITTTAMLDLGNEASTYNFIVNYKTIVKNLTLNYVGDSEIEDANITKNGYDTITATYNVELGTLPTPTATGYTFVGWYTSETIWTTETKVTEDSVWINEYTTLYAKWINNSTNFTLTINKIDAFWDSQDEPPATFNIGNAIHIINVIKNGYTFTGYTLDNDAYLNGVKVLAGTKLPTNETGYYIPANSFGNISVTSNFEIQQHSITFKVYNTETSTWEEYGILSGNYNTLITTLEGYTADKYLNNMAKDGFAFDGWYRTTSNFTNATKLSGFYGNKIYYEDLIVYAHYKDKLTAPENINIEQTSTIITWDAVVGATGYEVKIGGLSAVSTETNLYDSGVILTTADNYTIQVRAISNYRSMLNEDINSNWTLYNFTRNNTLNNSLLLSLRDGETLVKYIMFSGKTYTWTSASYQVRVSDLSCEGLVEVSVSNNEDVNRSELVVNSNKIGTFKLIVDWTNEGQPDSIYDVLVVEDATQVAYGQTYAQYLASVSPETTTKYLNKENPTPYLVGTKNDFIIDCEVKGSEGAFTDFDYSNTEKITFAFKVKDGENYRDAVGIEIPTENRDTENKSVSFKFDDSLVGKEYRVTVSLTYSKITTSLNPLGTQTQTFEFTLNDGYNAYTNDELKDLYGDKDVHVVNIMRNITAELACYQSQADGSPINIGSGRVFDNDANSTANNGTIEYAIADNKFTLNATQYTVDRTDPENIIIKNGETTVAQVSDNMFYLEGQIYVLSSDKITIYKTDGNIYKRAFVNAVNDRIEVNGNYCIIDASAIPVINHNYSLSTGSADDGINHQVGYISTAGSDFTLLRPHTGVFRYQSPYGGKATYNNLEIVGNLKVGPIVDETGNVFEDTSSQAYKDALSLRYTQQSGAVSGFWSETSEIILNNIIATKLHHGARADGSFKKFVENVDTTLKISPDATQISELPASWLNEAKTEVIAKPNNGKIESNYSYFSTMYCNAIYSWEGKAFKMFNSYGTDLSGPMVQIDNEGTVTNSIFVKDAATKCENWMAASNQWFTLWGLAPLANKMLTEFKSTFNNMGVSVMNIKDGAEMVNLVFVFRPCSNGDSVNEGIMENGEKTPESKAKSSTCTTYIGGVKTVINGENLTNGTVTTRTVNNLVASDMRVQNDIYSFSVTPYVSADQFVGAAAFLTALLQSTELQKAAINYVLNDAAIQDIMWNGTESNVGIKSIPITIAEGYSPTVENLIGSQAAFATIAENFWTYGVARNAVISSGYLSQPEIVFKATADNHAIYDGIIAGLISELNKSDGYALSLTTTVVSSKLTQEIFNEMWDIENAETSKLISLSTILVNGAGNAQLVVQFMLFKLCDIPTQDAQVLELGMGLASGNALQLIYCEYGFLDQEGWQV